MPILTVHPQEIVKAIKRQHMSEHYYYGMAAVLLTTCWTFTRTFKHQFGMPSCEYRKKRNDKQDNRINNILLNKNIRRL